MYHDGIYLSDHAPPSREKTNKLKIAIFKLSILRVCIIGHWLTVLLTFLYTDNYTEQELNAPIHR